jgi:thiol-disulfide isomerase/thioredoxin
MQRFCLYLLVFCCVSIASAQPKNRIPLILQGRLSNSPEKFLKLYYYDDNDKLDYDTVHLNDKGEFYLKTYNFRKPQRTDLWQNRTQINGIYVAPGYNLHITADATNASTLKATTKITGIGSESNQYHVKSNAFYEAKIDKRGWFEREPEEAITYIKTYKREIDSLHRKVFEQPQPKDHYFSYFKKMIDIDNQSMALTMMMQFSMNNGYSKAQMMTLVNSNTPPLFANGISNDDYLIAEDYIRWVVPIYHQYRNKLDELEDSTAVQKTDYALNLVNQLFTGKVKEYFLRYAVTKQIGGAVSIESLNNAKKHTQPLYDAITSAAVKRDIAAGYADRELQLIQLQIGKPAPPFSLPDDRGKVHHLADFKGKVIYIDLWASWCEPCRAEMPNFRKLKEKFKDSDKIAFMGIGVFDGEKEWRGALSEEKPDWLQLYDTSSAVAKSYVAASIPKYILIDKNGNVVNFNAPSPGDKSIEQLIKDEIAKP